MMKESQTTALAAATTFLTAFDNLDWETFRAFIAPEATVFMPFAHLPQRLNGKTEIEAAFQAFFAKVRQERLGPPYLHLVMLDTAVYPLNDDTVLITFHLSNPDHFSRRTLVFQRQVGQWLLLHLHASNMLAVT